MSDKNNPRNMAPRFPQKKTEKKLAPDAAMQPILAQNQALGKYLRVFCGSSSGSRREMIIHHPVGVTLLEKDEWVSSETTNIPLLLSRASDPTAKKIADQRSKWVMDQAVANDLLEKQEDGSYVYTGGKKTTRKAFSDELRKEFENAKAKDGGREFNIDIALLSTKDPRGALEIQLRESLPKWNEEAQEIFKSNYQTKGGIKADLDQVAIPWAKAKADYEVMDMLLLYGLTGPPAVDETAEDLDVKPAADAGIDINSTTTLPRGKFWCKLPASLSQDKKAEFRDALARVKKHFESETGKEFYFTISEIVDDDE